MPKGGYRYCLVIIDKFSKWVEAIPTRINSANTVARVVANQILPLWGAPIQIEWPGHTLHRSGDETNMPDAEHQTKVSHTVSTAKLRHGGTCQPHNKSCPETTAIRLTNDTQFNPTSEVKFSEGDMVMVRVFVKQGAFTPRWHGPYEVKAICNSCVATTVKGKLRWYHSLSANHSKYSE